VKRIKTPDAKKLPWNIFKGKIEFAEDFDAPLPEFDDYLRADNKVQPQMNTDAHR
jgi:hypothetical protein